MQSVEDKILRRIRAKPKGWVFTSNEFWDYGTAESVRKALQKLCDRGRIRRLARGLYDNPKQHPKLGVLEPTPEQIVEAIATKEHRKTQPTGAYAANLLGLSTQVPAKIIFLTDGPAKKVKVGKQTIQLKHCSPRMMAGAGTITGLVIQALRHIGQKGMTKKQVNVLENRLQPDQKFQLRREIKLAPAWIADIIRQISSETGQ